MKKFLLSIILLSTFSFGVSANFACDGSGDTVVSTCDINQNIDQNSTLKKYKEGVNYKTVELSKDIKTEKPNLVVYIWIGCPDCQNFKPYLKKIMNKYSNYEVIFRHSAKNTVYERDARIYYSMELMGKQELASKLMDMYVGIRKNGKMPDDIDFSGFFSSHGIEYEYLKTIMHSEKINNKIEITKEEMNNINLKWVPTVIVNGKYMALHDGIENEEEYLELIEYLINLK